jgi:hypothetical protein
MTGRIFTEALFNERVDHCFFRKLKPTHAKLAFVIDVLKGLDAFSGAAGAADRLAAALSDGSVRKVVDFLKSDRREDTEADRREDTEADRREDTEADRREATEADRREADRSEEGEDPRREQDEFAECVFKAIEKVAEDHEGFNNSRSYVHGLASTIAAVARAHIGTDDSEAGEAGEAERSEEVEAERREDTEAERSEEVEAERSEEVEAERSEEVETVEAVARKLAQNFHRACRYYGFLDTSSVFARRGRSMTHTREGLRLAFDGYSAQKAIAFMVEEQDRFLFGTTNLPRRLANLLLIATKRLTGSPRGYTSHDITQEQDSEAEATEASIERSEELEGPEGPEGPEPTGPAHKRTRLA